MSQTTPSDFQFLAQPVIEPAGQGKFLLYRGVKVARLGQVYTVPLGFKTDGASIPPIFWPIVGHPYSPSSLRAAILHDWMCRSPRTHGLASPEVHRIFFEALRADGVAWLRAKLMWAAVAIFGPHFDGRVEATQ